jgi:hypothetical protein
VKYVPVTERHPLKIGRDEKVGGAIAALGARRGLQAAGKKVLAKVGGIGIRQLAAGGAGVAGATLTAAAIAGVAAYYLTRYVLGRTDRLRATLQENAARASEAYRAARLQIEEDQGRSLTKSQQAQLGRAFQMNLQKLGLSKNDLSKLTFGGI